MSKKRYVVRLSKSEREDLSALIRRGKRQVSVLRRRHARVLLKVDQGKHVPSWSDVRTGEALEIHATTVRAIRERFVLARIIHERWARIPPEGDPSRQQQLDLAESALGERGSPCRAAMRSTSWSVHAE